MAKDDAKLPFDVLNMGTKGQRNLKREDLEAHYTDEELDELKHKYPSYDEVDLGEAKWGERFRELVEEAQNKTPKELRKWSPEEDAFLASSYLYLSDNTIALALNISMAQVRRRRLWLKLNKYDPQPKGLIIWCDRQNFDEDVKKLHLQKERHG